VDDKFGELPREMSEGGVIVQWCLVEMEFERLEGWRKQFEDMMVLQRECSSTNIKVSETGGLQAFQRTGVWPTYIIGRCHRPAEFLQSLR
jgi:hypothetical protein